MGIHTLMNFYFPVQACQAETDTPLSRMLTDLPDDRQGTSAWQDSGEDSKRLSGCCSWMEPSCIRGGLCPVLHAPNTTTTRVLLMVWNRPTSTADYLVQEMPAVDF